MAIQRDTRTRSLKWEEDAPTEPRFRRAQRPTPVKGRGLPGMPLEMPDFDELDEPLSPAMRKPASGAPWWKPATRFGRILLALGACAVFGASAYGYYRAKTFLEHDNRFRIQSSGDIAASGLSEVNREQLLPIFGEDIGRNIFFVNLAERRRQLEQIPWVESATVMRLLPNELKVSIVERRPVAFVRHGQTIGLVDANGVLLDMPAASLAKHHYSFPVVSGINVNDPPAARRARMQTYEHLVTDLDSTGQNYSSQISEIDLSDPDDARVTLPEQGSDLVAHFGASDFLARFQRYETHIAEWRQQYPQLSEVDLRYGQQVVLQMNHGTATAPAGTANLAQTQAKPSPAVAHAAPRTVEANSTKHVEHAAQKTSEKHTSEKSAKHPANETTHTTTSHHAKTTEHKTAAHKTSVHGSIRHRATSAQQRKAERLAREMRERRAKAHHQATTSGKKR